MTSNDWLNTTMPQYRLLTSTGLTLTGDENRNILSGKSGDDILSGLGGADTLSGNGGSDILVGGQGADDLWGGAGSDWAYYGQSSVGVTVNLALGTGTGGHAQGDRLHSIESVLGSIGADRLTGDGNQNSLYGMAGADVLAGGAGNDELMGGRGADTLDGGSGSDWASYRTAHDRIFIDLSKGTASGDEAAGDRLISIENLEGSAYADILSGNSRNNVFMGQGGEDILHGRYGADRLSGGAGNDFITGDQGNDIIDGGRGNDMIDGGTGEDVIRGGAGNDTIYGGPDPDVVVYDCAWKDLKATYDGSDYSVWVVAPDGTDHVFDALYIATTTGTYHFDVSSLRWIFDSAKTGDGWLGI